MGLKVALVRETHFIPRPPAPPPGRGIAWVPVRSSWIAALRWIETDRDSPGAYYGRGYIDMMTRPPYQHAYRYGPGINQRQFNTWRVAASRGKYWWRYFTWRWSPAQKLW